MERKAEPRAPEGGAHEYQRFYKGGEFEPFYVPRPLMPQVDEADFPALLQYATERKIDWAKVTLDPALIQPHQRIDHDMARHMDPSILVKPILISHEPFILDGNHRWWEHNHLHLPVSAYRFELIFEEAIKFLFSFPKTYSFAALKDPSQERN